LLPELFGAQHRYAGVAGGAKYQPSSQAERRRSSAHPSSPGNGALG
jgi:hypothetical protein